MPESATTKNLAAYHFGEFKLDRIDETLWRNGEKVSINRRMFQVLSLLIEKRGEIVTKQDFFDSVWNGSFVEDNNLTVTIAALRKALDDDSKKFKFIENLPRKGYRFVAKVEPDNTLPADQTVDRPITELAHVSPRSMQRRFAYSGATVGILVLISIVGLSFRAFWQVPAPLKRIDSVAVLPFATTLTDSEYVAEGMTDGISSALAKIQGLRVIDRNSTYHYKNADPDAGVVGRELNVKSLVTGRIEQGSDGPMVTVELTDVEHNKQLWQQQFKMAPGETVAVQKEIIRSISQNLNRDEQLSTFKPPTNDPEAYDLYIQGRYYWNKRTNPDIATSARFFQAAVDKDPNFAQAYIGLADAYAIGEFRLQGITSKQRVVLARSYVQKALDIDNTLGEGYAAIAIGQCYSDWDLASAEKNYQQAVQLSPNSATAHHWYAEFLSMLGRFSESAEEYARAIELDPLSLPIRTDFALSLYYNREYVPAARLLDEAKAMDPNYQRTYMFKGWVLREQGLFAESTREMDKFYEVNNHAANGSVATLEYYQSFMAQLRKAAETGGFQGFWRATAKSEITRAAGPYFLAVAYAKLGDKDQAFKNLDLAFDSHYTGMVWIKVDPQLENLRQDPRYGTMLRRVGLQ